MSAYGAEVRIPLNIQPQVRIPVQLLNGEVKNIDKHLKATLRYIRADLLRMNRFYIEDLLIESIPEQVDLQVGTVNFTFRISKATALEDGLEEYLGELNFAMQIEKVKDDLYLAKDGFQSVNYSSKLGGAPFTVAFGFKPGVPTTPSRLATSSVVE
jgi:hypothetical protein